MGSLEARFARVPKKVAKRVDFRLFVEAGWRHVLTFLGYVLFGVFFGWSPDRIFFEKRSNNPSEPGSGVPGEG